jgi:hypothetical protein
MVLSELESSETVQYISQLEEKLKARDVIVSEQSRQLCSLRHAKEALARRSKRSSKSSKHNEYEAEATAADVTGSAMSRVFTQPIQNSTKQTHKYFSQHQKHPHLES